MVGVAKKLSMSLIITAGYMNPELLDNIIKINYINIKAI